MDDFGVLAIPVLTIGFIGIIASIVLTYYLPSKYGEENWKTYWYPLFTVVGTLALCWAWITIVYYFIA